MEPLHNGHPLEPTFCQGVPNLESSSILLVGVVLRNRAVEHNVAMFSELSFAICWQGRLSRAYYYE